MSAPVSLASTSSSIPQTFRLVALDMDGTMLNQRHEISDRTKETLRRLSSNNVCISIATGRSSASVLKYLSDLQLPQRVVPIICFNGSCCLLVDQQDSSNTRVLFQDDIPAEHARTLIALVEEAPFRESNILQYYEASSGKVYARCENETHRELLRKYADLVGREQTIIDNYESVLTSFQSAKLLVLSTHAEELYSECAKKLPVGMFHTLLGSPSPFFVEFLKPDNHKGIALSKLCEHMSISMGEVVTMGDGSNDIEMLTAAGRGVAMLNAKADVKACTPFVSEYNNEEDGVAIELERLEAIGCFSPP